MNEDTNRKHINNALREELADEVVGAKFASTQEKSEHIKIGEKRII